MKISKKLTLLSAALALSSTLIAADAETEEYLDDLDTRLEKLETQVLLNKINFGFGFRQRADNFKQTMGDGSSFSDDNIWSTKFTLNLKTQITEDMKFNGRVAMFKYWADQGPNQQGAMDPKQGRTPNDSSFYVERAYVDWVLARGTVPVILTLGRQPSSDGPSHQFKDNTVRKATYSAFAFDGATEGLVLTLNGENLTGMENNALRLVYGKGYQEHDRNPQSFNPYAGVKETVPDNVMSGFFLDGSVPGVENSLLQIGYVSAKDVPEMVTSTGGYSSILGDITIKGMMAEFTNIENSGLDFFFHYGISTAKPNGNTAVMDGFGNMGLMTSMPGDTKDKEGTAFWTGLRYTIPYGNKPKIGFEYNKGDENWVNFTWGANDPSNKLATRGVATEIYYIHPINRFAHLRLGHTSIDYEYTNSGNYHGMPMEIAKLPAPMKGMFTDKLENTYLLFNVLF